MQHYQRALKVLGSDPASNSSPLIVAPASGTGARNELFYLSIAPARWLG